MMSDMGGDSLGDGVGNLGGSLGDSLGDSFDAALDDGAELDEALADFMPIADSPAEVEAELEDIDFEGFIEIDPDSPPTIDEDPDDIAAALEEYGYPTDDLGQKPKEYEFKEWVAKETGVSKDVAGKAGHEARDGMEDIGWVPPSRSESKKGS